MRLPFSSSIAVPIKKRRFPVIECASPLPEAKPSTSEDVKHDSIIPDAKASGSDTSKQEPQIPDVKLSGSGDDKQESHLLSHGVSTGTSDLSKSSVLVVPDPSVEFPQPNVGTSESKPQKPDPVISLGTMDDMRKATEMLSSESASLKVCGSSVGADIVSTEPEIVKEQKEGTCALNLLTGSQNVLALEPKEPTLDHLICETEISKKSDPVSFNLSVGEDKLVLHDNDDKTIKTVGVQTCANRSNWDLNTSMDEWEGSTHNDLVPHSTVDVGGSNKAANFNDVECSLNNRDVETTAGLSLSKEKYILNEQISSTCNTSMLSSQQCKPDAILGLSLATPLDSSWKHHCVSEKTPFTNTGLKLQKEQVSTTDVNVSSLRGAVKLEPVDENSECGFSIDSGSSNMGIPKSSSMKRELVEKQHGETVLPSPISLQKLVDHRPVKSELVREGNLDVCKSESCVLPQYVVGRVMQHQESTASSSATSMPLTPQNSCPSRLSVCSELTICGDKSTHFFELHGLKAKANEPIASTVSEPLSIDGKESWLCKSGNLKVEGSENFTMTRVNPSMSCGISDVAANGEEKINLSAEMLEEDTLGSDCGSYDLAVATPVDEGRKPCDEEDGEYEEGELREPLPRSARKDPLDAGKKSDALLLLESDSKDMQPGVFSGEQSTNTSEYDGKSAISENHDENHSDHIKECVIVGYEPYGEDNSLQKLSDTVPGVGFDDKRSISVALEKRVGLSRQIDASKDTGEEVSSDGPTNISHETGTLLDDNDNDNVVKKICMETNDSSFSAVEASIHGNDVGEDFNNLANKSRIITLPRASTVTNSGRTRSFPNRFLTSRNGKERYSDLDEDLQSRGNRTDNYADGSSKFLKDRVHDPSLRNARPSFMLGKGRGSGRFGPLRNEWDTAHDFASEYNGPSNYRVTRHKHATPMADVELGYDGYGVGQDSPGLGGSRRKAINDDKFMRHLPDNVVDPVFSRSQPMYDEFDSQPTRGNRNFSTMHRKGYPRIQSKSPVRSRTRSPGPWSSRRRRSPEELQEFNQHRSPTLYRMRRMGSPDRSCFRDEMVSRNRGSPPYVGRHTNELRDVDCGREHVHPRPVNSNRRNIPARVFQRSDRRGDVLESRERGDGSIDERRKFLERREPFHSFRPSYNEESENFRFHQNDGPRPYRFCQDADAEFVERNNMRERDFNGRIKHQPSVVSRRNRDMEEQADGNYRPGGRVWHDEDVSGMKRRRF